MSLCNKILTRSTRFPSSIISSIIYQNKIKSKDFSQYLITFIVRKKWKDSSPSQSLRLGCGKLFHLLSTDFYYYHKVYQSILLSQSRLTK